MNNQLNPNQNLMSVSSRTPEGLRAKLAFIRTPYSTFTIYHDGKNHVAWIRTDRKLNQRVLSAFEKIEKELT